MREWRVASPPFVVQLHSTHADRGQRCCVKSSHMAPKLERIIRDLQLHMFQWVPLCLGASLSPAHQLMITTPISKFNLKTAGHRGGHCDHYQSRIVSISMDLGFGRRGKEIQQMQ